MHSWRIVLSLLIICEHHIHSCTSAFQDEGDCQTSSTLSPLTTVIYYTRIYSIFVFNSVSWCWSTSCEVPEYIVKMGYTVKRMSDFLFLHGCDWTDAGLDCKLQSPRWKGTKKNLNLESQLWKYTNKNLNCHRPRRILSKQDTQKRSSSTRTLRIIQNWGWVFEQKY